MNSFTKCLGLGVLIFAFMLVAACDRTVTTVEETTTPENCFSCHSDQNTAIVAAEGQWENSVHASGAHVSENSTSCSGCHTSEGFVRRFTGQPAATIENPTAIHCFTCHAPHTNGDLSLRVTDVQPLMNGESYDLGAANICSACHHSRRNVDTYVALDTVTMSQRYGPHHSVQADMLIGSNGYEYSFYTYEQLTFHKAATEDACLDCHFRTTINYVLGGHSFNMSHEAEGGGEEINTEGCNVDACHAGNMVDFNYHNVQDSVTTLAAQLEQLLIDAKLLRFYTAEETGGEEGFFPYDRDVYSRDEPGDSTGAVWNYFMAIEDRSEGVHNSKYIIGLLQSAIQFLQPVPAASNASVAAGGRGGAAN
jgi:hypothetical protein